MYLRKTSLACAAIALMALSGCATTKPALEGRMDTRLGSAVKANVNAHAVVPTPQQKANTYIPADPSRAALARKKYRENTVEEPQAVNQSGG